MVDRLQITVEPHAVGVYASPTQNENKKQQISTAMLIELTDGVYLNPELIAVVRPSTLDDDQTVVFTAGASAVDGGHLIDMPVEEVVELLQRAQRQTLAMELAEEMEAELGTEKT